MALRNAYNRVDPSSLSDPTQVTIDHLSLDWTLDFDARQIHGEATLSMRIVNPSATCVTLDSRDLFIERAYLNDKITPFSIDAPTGALGSKITVQIPSSILQSDNGILESGKFNLKFKYSVSPSASAVQWLDATATTDKQHPFVFTQSQAIHARSLFPCIDSPGVKHTYTATIHCPIWCTALMSAVAIVPPSYTSTQSIHTWKQDIPVSSYLIALAAGLLSSYDVSERVRIWAEPSVIASAAYEFADTELFLATAEELMCEYCWGRYDVLCLPPSFPYGGMENPCLTFATPTLLAGDRSLADVIAHEIAHSWCGNLVTNHTWEHFWLNEGMTVWLERKIIGRTKSMDAFNLSAQIGAQHLAADVARLGEDSPFSKLVWELEGGADPDDAFSAVPYEKGFNFLYYLELQVGTDAFEAFIKAYIHKFKYATVVSGEFKDFFLEYMAENEIPLENELKSDEFWDTVFYSTGLSAEFISSDFSNILADNALKLVMAITVFDLNKGHTKHPLNPRALEGWSTQQKCLFLERLTEASKHVPITVNTLSMMDELYHMSETKNAEVKLRWQMLCLQSDAQFIIPFVLEFIQQQGRMKFVRPLYRALATLAPDTAIRAFTQNAMLYHPIARKMIENDLAKINAARVSPVVPTSSEQVAPVDIATDKKTSYSSSTSMVVVVCATVAVVVVFAFMRGNRKF